MPVNVDNSPAEGEGSGKVVTAIEAAADDMSVKKYKELVKYRAFIIQRLQEGKYQAEVVRALWEEGYIGGKSNAEYYIKSIREELGITISKSSVSREQKRKQG